MKLTSIGAGEGKVEILCVCGGGGGGGWGVYRLHIYVPITIVWILRKWWGKGYRVHTYMTLLNILKYSQTQWNTVEHS